MKLSMSSVVPLFNHDFAIYRLLESRIFLVLVGCKGCSLHEHVCMMGVHLFDKCS